MNVESNYAIAALSDWLKSLTPAFKWPIRNKPKANRALYAWFFHPLSKLLPTILIDLTQAFLPLWLVGLITLVLVFRQTFKNRCKSRFFFSVLNMEVLTSVSVGEKRCTSNSTSTELNWVNWICKGVESLLLFPTYGRKACVFEVKPVCINF